jgi:uncharacterized protein (TIGR02246 family)
MRPTELADRYFASVRARDIDGFIALFAEDATFIRPDGIKLSGRTAIREMELGVFTTGAPTPSRVASVESDNAIAVEVDVRLADGTMRHMANFFQLNVDGHIQRLSVYRQGG